MHTLLLIVNQVVGNVVCVVNGTRKRENSKANNNRENESTLYETISQNNAYYIANYLKCGQ